MDRETLKRKRVVDLRTFARSVGVKSATTFRKSDLINQIIKALSGEIEPSISNRGRKPKIILNFDLNTITREQMEKSRVVDLMAFAREIGIQNSTKLKKDELMTKILERKIERNSNLSTRGRKLLEPLNPKDYFNFFICQNFDANRIKDLQKFIEEMKELKNLFSNIEAVKKAFNILFEIMDNLY